MIVLQETSFVRLARSDDQNQLCRKFLVFIVIPALNEEAKLRSSVRSVIDAAKVGLTDFLYQRDGEIVEFSRPDLAVSGTGSSFVAQTVDIRAMSAVGYRPPH